MATNLVPKNAEKYYCENCDYTTSRNSQYQRHLLTSKHKKHQISTNLVPKVPEFGDKNIDGPIREMEKIIKEMTSQRNYEVEQINKNYQHADSWLKSQETSIKNDKNLTPPIIPTENEYNKLRHIKIENEEITLISPEKRKNVTWGDNSEIENIKISENINLTADNIFKKLKKVNTTQPTIVFEEPIINDSKEDRIQNLENEVKSLNIKMDMLINLLKQNK